jgi:pyruvate formate lyase activating enzyme
MRNLPETPADTLERAKTIAVAEGIHHVYVGNLARPEGNNTYCPSCNRLLVERHGFAVVRNDIAAGKCPACGTEIKGIWI